MKVHSEGQGVQDMRSNNIPKTLQTALDKYSEIIAEYHMEEDFFSDTPYSIWITLKDGYTWDGIRTIHEATAKKAIEALKNVQKDVDEDISEDYTVSTPTKESTAMSTKKTVKVTYRQAVKLFKAGKISEDTFEKIYQANTKAVKVQHEKNCVDVTVEPMF